MSLASVKNILREKHGMLPVKEKQTLLTALECTEDQLMLALLQIAREFAVVPVSGYKVGAVALGETGNLYLGANQELSHVALNEAIHAEQSAVAVAYNHGETNITKMAINAHPCGHCRQFLYECVAGDHIEILIPDHPSQKLSLLLPLAFGPKDLQVADGLFAPQHHDLTLSTAANDALKQAAWQAAKRSYAPYTNAYSGFALQTQDGTIFTGSYLENAAFNPSLSALQTTLALLIQSGYTYQDVVSGVFLQVKNHLVDQAPATQLIFSALCLNARGNLLIDTLD